MRAEDVEPGHLVCPDEPSPGVVMIHDVWGLSDHTRDLAGRLAGEGYAVLAVDLYRRQFQGGEVRIGDPGGWMRDLSDVEVLADLQAAIDWLAAQPAVGGGKIGITGFCMGGMYALLAAASCRGLAASVAYYGLLSHEHGILHGESGPDPRKKPRQPLAAASELACPLLAFFGDRDDFVPLEDVDELRRRLRSSPARAEVVVYEGAGHAFMNDTRPEAYRPEIAAKAWARMLEFFREQLA